MAVQAYCSGCMRIERVDASWRALWIDSDGDLRISDPLRDCDIDYERPDTVFACGQGSALRLTERYLHYGNFTLAQTATLAMQGNTCSDPTHTSL